MATTWQTVERTFRCAATDAFEVGQAVKLGTTANTVVKCVANEIADMVGIVAENKPAEAALSTTGTQKGTSVNVWPLFSGEVKVKLGADTALGTLLNTDANAEFVASTSGQQGRLRLMKGGDDGAVLPAIWTVDVA